MVVGAGAVACIGLDVAGWSPVSASEKISSDAACRNSVSTGSPATLGSVDVLPGLRRKA
jgi:hypothetical protein